jgi:hypothetical protein
MSPDEIKAYMRTPEFEQRCQFLNELLDHGPVSDEASAAVLGVPVDLFRWALAEQAKKWSPQESSV